MLVYTLSQFFVFFFNDTATTEIYTLSLHDALPIYRSPRGASARCRATTRGRCWSRGVLTTHAHDSLAPRSLRGRRDRKSTRLNSSHANISYAVFCLKKKKTKESIGRRLHSVCDIIR